MLIAMHNLIYLLPFSRYCNNQDLHTWCSLVIWKEAIKKARCSALCLNEDVQAAKQWSKCTYIVELVPFYKIMCNELLSIAKIKVCGWKIYFRSSIIDKMRKKNVKKCDLVSFYFGQNYYSGDESARCLPLTIK